MSPFQKAVPIARTVNFAEVARKLAVPEEEVRKAHELALTDDLYLNDTYQVAVRRIDGPMPMIHLSIKRIDKQPVHDWRDLQQIKNELTDPEFDACELYPAESRLVDTANQYHLWVFANKDYRIPVGWDSGRLVSGEAHVDGAVQRPFTEGGN